jgi:plasmid stability protein
MRRMPTLYIRNVPPEVYEALKARAKREGRSVNAEALRILEDVAEREQRGRALADRLRELAAAVAFPPDGPSAAEMIRQARDDWDARIERASDADTS